MKGNIYRKSRHKRSRNPICGLVKLHPKTRKRQIKWKPKECVQIAQVRIIKVDSFGRSGLLRFTNDEEITRIPTIFMLCVKPHIRSVSSCKSSRANEEQIKQLLIIHSHTVICIKFQANTKLFE